MREEGAVALGEIGLDYYYDHSPRDVQVRVFREQLRIARDSATPNHISPARRVRRVHADLREEWKPGMRGVVHCFTGTPAQARVLCDEFGLFLGIGGRPDVSKSASAYATRSATSASRALVLETDSPYLAPVPKRGKRNEPAYVTRTAAKLAELLALPLDEVVSATDANAFKLFGI